jgi:hypothetical protein
MSMSSPTGSISHCSVCESTGSGKGECGSKEKGTC